MTTITLEPGMKYDKTTLSRIEARTVQNTFLDMGCDYIEGLECLKIAEDAHELGLHVPLNKAQRALAAAVVKTSPYVYFLVAKDCGLVKIGKTKRPRQRFQNIQSGCPHDLAPAACVRAPEAMESALHKIHADSARRGEWFALSEGIVASIKAAQAGPASLVLHAMERGAAFGENLSEQDVKKVLDSYSKT